MALQTTALTLPQGSSLTETAGVTLTFAIPGGSAWNLIASAFYATGTLALGTSTNPWNGCELANNAFLKGRNAANTADIVAAGINAANQVQLGDGTDAGVKIATKVATVGPVSAVNLGVPATVGSTGLLSGQSANIAATTLVASAPLAALYEVFVWIAVTQAATTSSTLPSVTITFSNGVSQTIAVTTTQTGNTTTTFAEGRATIRCAAGTTIQYATTGYVSSGATPMQYEVYVVAEVKQ